MIRMASPSDAAAIAAIDAPVVERTAISFELNVALRTGERLLET